ncbi:hypothetical protein MRX96_057665 [Rhipicephalus microplus]
MADTTVAAAAAAASTAKSFCIEALLARDSGRATPASKSPGSCSEGDAASPPPSSIPVSVAAVVASQAAGRLLGAIPGYHPVLQAGHPLYGLQAAGGGLPAGALPGLLPGSAFHPTLTEHGIKSHVSLDWLARTAGFYQRPGDVMSDRKLLASAWRPEDFGEDIPLPCPADPARLVDFESTRLSFRSSVAQRPYTPEEDVLVADVCVSSKPSTELSRMTTSVATTQQKRAAELTVRRFKVQRPRTINFVMRVQTYKRSCWWTVGTPWTCSLLSVP